MAAGLQVGIRPEPIKLGNTKNTKKDSSNKPPKILQVYIAWLGHTVLPKHDAHLPRYILPKG
jgi:hypothetical protein